MNRKIATITFHWATNYGAVLQAYALQQALLKDGYRTEIIDYIPWSVIVQQQISWRKNHQNYLFLREKKLEEFRKEYLVRTKKIHRARELSRFSTDYYAVICGSDQIWNESFTLTGEFKQTLAYYLNFTADSTKRIAYAASFGTNKTSNEFNRCVEKEIRRFDAISVREQSGVNIVNKLGMDAVCVCDPTLLLQAQDYHKLIKQITFETDRVYSYILHDHSITKQISEHVKKLKFESNATINNEDGLLEWIYRIANSEIVVTNSFHGVMLSIILNTPFLAVLIKGSGMNDRINTILKSVGLEERVIDECDTEKIESILSKSIDWEAVNNKLEISREIGKQFIRMSLSE